MRTRFAKRAGATILTSALLIGGFTSSSMALSQITGPAYCSTEIRVASKTTGHTYHKTSAGQTWDKGYKNNAGATSYTGYISLGFVQTDAPTIASSGYACR